MNYFKIKKYNTDIHQPLIPKLRNPNFFMCFQFYHYHKKIKLGYIFTDLEDEIKSIKSYCYLSPGLFRKKKLTKNSGLFILGMMILSML